MIEEYILLIILSRVFLVTFAYIFSILLWSFVTQWVLLFFYDITPCVLVNVFKKVQVNANYTLEQGTKAKKRSRYIALPFL